MLSVLPSQIGSSSEQRTAATAALCSLVPAAEFHFLTARSIIRKLDDRIAILKVPMDHIALTLNKLGLRQFCYEPGYDDDYDSDIDDGHVTYKEMQWSA
jgi:hypothetical protein